MFLPISLLKINARDKQKKGFMISIGIMVKYFASIHRGGVLVAPKTERQKHFCTHRAHRKRAQKSSRDHPSVPPTRASGPFSRVPFETAVSSLSIASKKRRETRARAHSPPKLSLHIAVVFRAFYKEEPKKKDARNQPADASTRPSFSFEDDGVSESAHKSEERDDDDERKERKKGARVKAYHGDKKSSSRCNKE